MGTRKGKADQDLIRLYSRERCIELVNGLTDLAEGVDVDGLTRALLPIFDLSNDGGAREAAGNLMRAAYEASSEVDEGFMRHLDRLRQEAEARKPAKKSSEDKESLREAADRINDAKDEFVRLVEKHAYKPHTRARIVQMIESRTCADNETVELIEPVDGDTYIFTDERGFSALTVTIAGDTKHLIVEAKDVDGKTTNGFLANYSEKGREKTKDLKPSKAPKADATPAANTSNERLSNAIQLGEHLAAILRNPELPAELRKDIEHRLADLYSDAEPRTSTAEDVERNWPQVVEMLLTNKQKGEMKNR